MKAYFIEAMIGDGMLYKKVELLKETKDFLIFEDFKVKKENDDTTIYVIKNHKKYEFVTCFLRVEKEVIVDGVKKYTKCMFKEDATFFLEELEEDFEE